MRRYIDLLIISMLLFTLSCDKDFLERYPLDELIPQDFFNSPEELKLYANRFYTLLPAHSEYFYTFWIDRNSDNLVHGNYDTRLAGTRTVPSSGAGWDWGDIRQANYFLKHCGNAEGVETDINHYIGEVRFFRAYLYFDKVKNFGDVPWISEPMNTNSEELFAPRNSRIDVVDSIIADLDYAISNLKTASRAEPFRINRESALLLKARICLYEGTWQKYHYGTPFGVQGSDGSRFLELAAGASNQLMEMNTFSIYQGPEGEEYWSLFNQYDYTGNPEVMLWKKYDVGLGITHNMSRYIPHGTGRIGMSKSLIDSYLCEDGDPISVSPLFQGYDSLWLEVTNRDPRLLQSLLLPGYYMVINSPGGANDRQYELPTLDGIADFRNTTGYAIYKGSNPDWSQQTADNIGTTASIIFRYAEALLIHAEAKAELGTLTQEDVDRTVNVLRNRVGMAHLNINNISHDPSWEFPALSPVINEIRRERRVELACEGFRWDDLARWKAHHLITGQRPRGVKYIGSNLEGAYKDYDGNPTIFIGQNLFVDENGFVDPYQNVLPNGYGFNPGRDYLSPIPSDEITLNSNIIQNPGW
ncbi:MAG: RagB/SusD family nutrient uptake outer membrane protein [Bacteroidales bacterium]